MSVGKVGKFSMTMKEYDARIEALKAEIVKVQREKIKASIEMRRAIDEESQRRSKAKTQEVAA
jgi:23S rRNA pseudoU1915 N3-methylase RlmH